MWTNIPGKLITAIVITRLVKVLLVCLKHTGVLNLVPDSLSTSSVERTE